MVIFGCSYRCKRTLRPILNLSRSACVRSTWSVFLELFERENLPITVFVLLSAVLSFILLAIFFVGWISKDLLALLCAIGFLICFLIYCCVLTFLPALNEILKT